MHGKLEEFLGARQSEHEAVIHPGAVSAQEQAAASHTPGGRFAKVVVVKERDGYVLAVVPATCVVDLDRLKGLIGHGELRLATVEEIARAVPDCAPGAIPPFGALWRLRTCVDRRLLAGRDFTMPAGDLATAIRMRVSEYRRLATPQEGDFAVPGSLATSPRPHRKQGPGHEGHGRTENARVQD